MSLSAVPGGPDARLQLTRRDVDGDGSMDAIIHKKGVSPDIEALFVLMGYDGSLNADDFYGAGLEIT